jgi:hypothetical protein
MFLKTGSRCYSPHTEHRENGPQELSNIRLSVINCRLYATSNT